jgi:hypothetical protein
MMALCVTRFCFACDDAVDRAGSYDCLRNLEDALGRLEHVRGMIESSGNLEDSERVSSVVSSLLGNGSGARRLADFLMQHNGVVFLDVVVPENIAVDHGFLYFLGIGFPDNEFDIVSQNSRHDLSAMDMCVITASDVSGGYLLRSDGTVWWSDLLQHEFGVSRYRVVDAGVGFDDFVAKWRPKFPG